MKSKDLFPDIPRGGRVMNEHIVVIDVPVRLTRWQSLRMMLFRDPVLAHLRARIRSTAEYVDIDYITVEQRERVLRGDE